MVPLPTRKSNGGGSPAFARSSGVVDGIHHVSVPGTGHQFTAEFDAMCAATGAMGCAQSNYYVSGDPPHPHRMGADPATFMGCNAAETRIVGW